MLPEARRTSTPAMGPTCSASCRVISLSDSGPMRARRLRRSAACGPGWRGCLRHAHLRDIACRRAAEPILLQLGKERLRRLPPVSRILRERAHHRARKPGGDLRIDLVWGHRRVLQVRGNHLDMELCLQSAKTDL